MTDSVANFLDRQGFALESSALKAISEVFAREADLALRGEVSSLQMIDSHLDRNGDKSPFAGEMN